MVISWQPVRDGGRECLTMTSSPVAFLSYVNTDDQYEDGAITKLREKLEGEVRMQTGDKSFRIFQDRNDVKWGDAWEERILGAVDEATFLILVLTPSWFTSEFCRKELQRFLEIERQRGRKDRVLPILYMECPVLTDPELRAADPLAQELHERQYFDWRPLRWQPLQLPEARLKLAAMGEALRQALVRASRPPAAASATSVRAPVVTPAGPASPASPASSAQALGTPGPRGLEALTRLLLAMFSADELRRLIRYLPGAEDAAAMLPGNTVSASQLAHEAVIVLERHVLIDRAFFHTLEAERPRRSSEIRQVAGLWGLA